MTALVTALSASLAVTLASLHARAFADTGRPWPGTEILSLAAAGGAVLVVDRIDAPSGFALFRQVLDESELLTIAIDPAQWNKGIGQALLRHGLKHLAQNGCCSLYLEVAETNARAIVLYDRLGFYPVGRRPGYYGNGVSDCAIVMRRDL